MRLADSLPQQRLAQLRRLRRRALKCRPLRCSQRRRKKGLKRFFAQQPRRCSAPRATTQRRRICASRCCRDLVSIRGKHPLLPIRDYVSSASARRRGAAFEASSRSGAPAEFLRACCLSERSERVHRPAAGASTAEQARSARRLGSATALRACARDVATTYCSCTSGAF